MNSFLLPVCLIRIVDKYWTSLKKVYKINTSIRKIYTMII